MIFKEHLDADEPMGKIFDLCVGKGGFSGHEDLIVVYL